MLATCPLVIKRRKLRELHILRGKITACVNAEIAPSIRVALVNRDNLAVTHVRDCVGGLDSLERLPCLPIHLKIARQA